MRLWWSDRGPRRGTTLTLAAVVVVVAAAAVQLALQTRPDVALTEDSPGADPGWPVSARFTVRVAGAQGELVNVGEYRYEASGWTRWRLQEIGRDGEIACYEQDGRLTRAFVIGPDGCDGQVVYESGATVDAQGRPAPNSFSNLLAAGLLDSAIAAGAVAGPPEGAVGAVGPEHLVTVVVEGECSAGRCSGAATGRDRTERWVFDRRTGVAVYRRVVEAGVVTREVEAVELRTGPGVRPPRFTRGAPIEQG